MNWVTGSPPQFDTLLAILYQTYLKKFNNVCVCTPPPLFFRHDRRTATKFGRHVRIDTGLALT